MATEPPKHKRRWFRFSLKTFLVLVTLFCVLMAFLGALVYRVNQQREVIQWVEDNGGKVYYDFEWNEEKGLIDAEPPGPDWLRALVGVDFFADVVFVDFNESIYVSDIGPLRDLTQLQLLSLVGTQVSDLSPLRELKQLRELFLVATQVTDLSPLRELTQLKRLDLDYAQVSDLEPLRKLTQLGTLYLNDTQVTDLAPLSELTQLHELYLGNTNVSDLSPLRNLTQLQTLDLDRTQVSDLSPLRDLTQLQWLDFSGTQVSQAQFTMLQFALPKCRISSSSIR